jgi:hypothetical protein
VHVLGGEQTQIMVYKLLPQTFVFVTKNALQNDTIFEKKLCQKLSESVFLN